MAIELEFQSAELVMFSPLLGTGVQAFAPVPFIALLDFCSNSLCSECHPALKGPA